MNKKKIFNWQIIGALFIIVVGSIFHYVYEWTGQFKPAAFLWPVNESVWEHLKMVLWPALIFALFEYRYLMSNVNNYLIAKTTSIVVAMILIVGGFYLYTSLLGTNSLIIDILLFIISVVIGQLVSYKLLTSKTLPEWVSKLALIVLLILMYSFIVFTYYPPKLPIFKDSLTGKYGVEL